MAASHPANPPSRVSTDWVRVDGLAKATSYLPARLPARVVGGIADHTPSRVAESRGETIATFAASRGITHWIAVDDDDYRWPQGTRGNWLRPIRQKG